MLRRAGGGRLQERGAVALTPNDGTHQDVLVTNGGTITYRICEQGTTVCSNTASVSY